MKIVHHLERAQWMSRDTHAIEIAGWCFRPDENVDAIEAWVGGACVARAAMQNRPDVQSFHDGNPHALDSGFVLALPLVELEQVIELRAVTGSDAAAFFRVRAGDLPHRGPVVLNYAKWSAALAHAGGSNRRGIAEDHGKNSARPLISLLLPVFNTPKHFLADAVGSVLQQTYSNWELRIVDDGSPNPETRASIAELGRRDPRIHVCTLPANAGISHATNRALQDAAGEFVGFLDHDDRLYPEALALVAERLVSSGADAVYTDEEKITANGVPCAPVFKPDFSPEFLRGVMYVGHFLCVRTALARSIGGFRPEFDGIQDFEFFLRFSETSLHIEHLRKVLYQWRLSPSSSALVGNVKGDMDQRQLEAVQQHLRRTGQRANAEKLGAHRVRLLPAPPQEKCLVVARDPAQVQNIAIAGHETAILPPDARLGDLARLLRERPEKKILWINETLRFSDPRAVDGLLGFLDDSSVGAVAPTLLAADGRVFAAGGVHSPSGKIVPAMRGFSSDGDGYNGSLVCNREVSLVLSACVAFRSADLLAGLQATAHPFSDAGMAELCGAFRGRGLRVLNCAAIQARTSRDWDGQQSVGTLSPGEYDPYFSEHFNAETGDYRLARPA